MMNNRQKNFAYTVAVLLVIEAFHRHYIVDNLIALDQVFNTVLAGEPTETFSSRMGRAQRRGNLGARAVCIFLDAFDEDHCEESARAREALQPPGDHDS